MGGGGRGGQLEVGGEREHRNPTRKTLDALTPQMQRDGIRVFGSRTRLEGQLRQCGVEVLEQKIRVRLRQMRASEGTASEAAAEQIPIRSEDLRERTGNEQLKSEHVAPSEAEVEGHQIEHADRLSSTEDPRADQPIESEHESMLRHAHLPSDGRSAGVRPLPARQGAANPTAQWTHYLQDLYRFLHDQAGAERAALVELRANRQEHPIIGAASEAIASVKAGFHSVNIPELAIWDQVSTHLEKARSLLLGGDARLDAAKDELATATKLFHDAHRKIYEYRTAMEGGGEAAVSILRGIEVGCDITLTVLSAGIGAGSANVAKLGARGVFKLAAEQAAKDGLGKTALKAATVGGANRLAQGAAEHGAARAVGVESEVDIAGLLSEAGEAAVMNLLGVLIGGALNVLFMRKLGEVIGSHLPPEALAKVIERYGVVGKIPPELFVAKGWRFFVGIASDACTTVLLTAASMVVAALRDSTTKVTAEQLTVSVIEQMIRNGLLQVVIGSLMHSSVEAKRTVAADFYGQTGWNKDRIAGHLTGIDFSKPLEVVVLKKGTVMAQWQSPGAPQGTYYSQINYTPEQLGIGAKGTARVTREVIDKRMTLYRIVKDVEALHSICSAPDDVWSVTGMVQPTEGGGEQFFSSDASAFETLETR